MCPPFIFLLSIRINTMAKESDILNSPDASLQTKLATDLLLKDADLCTVRELLVNTGLSITTINLAVIAKKSRSLQRIETDKALSHKLLNPAISDK